MALFIIPWVDSNCQACLDCNQRRKRCLQWMVNLDCFVSSLPQKIALIEAKCKITQTCRLTVTNKCITFKSDVVYINFDFMFSKVLLSPFYGGNFLPKYCKQIKHAAHTKSIFYKLLLITKECLLTYNTFS